jgi:hypothetical protein
MIAALELASALAMLIGQCSSNESHCEPHRDAVIALSVLSPSNPPNRQYVVNAQEPSQSIKSKDCREYR